MNELPLVSIIIPVYKVERYLDECVRSVIAQTYKNLEIILVDDGSPDRCGEMCDLYAQEDSRIYVIHKENNGVAKARNSGLENVHGEFIFFLDSDDVMDIQCIETLLNLSKQYHADMVCAECIYIDENSKIVSNSPNINPSDTKFFKTQEAMLFYASKEWAPWNRLIRADVHNGIRFPNYKIHEDEAIKFLLLERCSIVVHSNKQTYYYRQRRNSITSVESSVDRMDMFYSRLENYEYLKKAHPDIMEYFLPNLCEAALYNLGIILHKESSEELSKRINEIIKFSMKNYMEIKKNPYLSHSQKMRFMLIKYSDWTKKKCFYMRFYTFLAKIRGRRQ